MADKTVVDNVIEEVAPIVEKIIPEVAPIVAKVVAEVPVVETEVQKVLKELDALVYRLETSIKGDFTIAMARIRSHLKL